VVRHRLLREIFSTSESAEPAYSGPIDEYRALAVLASAWERYCGPRPQRRRSPRSAKLAARPSGDANRTPNTP